MSIPTRSMASSLLACATTLALLSGASTAAGQEKATLPGTTCYEVTEAPGPVQFINNRGDAAYGGPNPGLILAGSQRTESFFPFPPQNFNARIILAGLAEDGTLAATFQGSTNSFPSVDFSGGLVKRPGEDPVEISIAGSQSVSIATISADGTVAGSARFELGGLNNYEYRAFIGVRNAASPNGYRVTLFRNGPQPTLSHNWAVDVQGPLTLLDGFYPQVHDRRRSTRTEVWVPNLHPDPEQRSYFAPRLLLADGSAVIGSRFTSSPWGQHQRAEIVRKEHSASGVESYRLVSPLPSLASAPFGLDSRINAAAADTLVGTMGTQLGYLGGPNQGGRAIIHRIGEDFSTELSSLLCAPPPNLTLVEAFDITAKGQILVHGRDERSGPFGYTSVYLLTPVVRPVELK